MTLAVYSDGSSSGGRDTPGGWSWIVVRDHQVLLAGYGGDAKTTNNLMELQGAYCGLEAVIKYQIAGKDEPIALVSDSLYVLRLASGEFKAKKNLKEVQRLREAVIATGATTRWVKGHSIKQGIAWQEHSIDILMNVRADSLAKYGKAKIIKELAASVLADIP